MFQGRQQRYLLGPLDRQPYMSSFMSSVVLGSSKNATGSQKSRERPEKGQGLCCQQQPRREGSTGLAHEPQEFLGRRAVIKGIKVGSLR